MLNALAEKQKSLPLPQWQGAKLVPLLAVIILGLVMWNLPVPTGLTQQTWHLFSIFVSTIVAVILKPLPMGAIAVVSLGLCNVTGVLTLEESLSSFSSSIVWLVIFAFFIARGFINTGLGTRIAYMFVSALGKNTLGLSYGLVLTEVILAPLIPSNTARGAGVMFPIVSSLTTEFSSTPQDGTQRKIGSYLMKVCFQVNIITSAMFMTALAGNPLIASLAGDAGAKIDWGTWALAASIPGALNLILVPLILYYIYPPEVKQTPEAQQMAKRKLNEIGSLKFQEVLMLGVFFMLISLWIFGDKIGMESTTAALIGFGLLLFSGVLKWDDVLKEKSAWNTLIWFATLLMMATYLTKLGMVSWFSQHMQGAVSTYHWMTALGVLGLVYFYSHYFFASVTAHISAMYSAFLVVAIAAGAPPFMAAMLLAAFSSLSGGLTHFGTGTAPVYFGAGYIEIRDWWRLGAIISIVNLLIWAFVGAAWWKVIGYW